MAGTLIPVSATEPAEPERMEEKMPDRKTILGIVAEYDPFHNGHALHLSASRKTVCPDSVYIVLSPCLKQRGELSMLSPFDRAACAVHEGADAVFSLPVLWTVRDAEHYAFGAVRLLAGLGITHLAFGAETPDLALLDRIAGLLEDAPACFTETLNRQLSGGRGYPAALSAAIESCMPGAGSVLSRPNNILAVCYLRVLRRIHPQIIPVVIPRRGSYHNPDIQSDSPSASALRENLFRGIYLPAFASMPAFSAGRVKAAFLNRRIPDPRITDSLLIRKLRTADLSSLPDLSEGLENALRKAASVCSSREQLLQQLSTRRYPGARISRLMASAMLDITRSRLDSLLPPDQTLLLSLRKKTALSDRWKDLPVKIHTAAPEWKKAADPEDLAAWKLWAVCCGLPDSVPFSEKIYTE